MKQIVNRPFLLALLLSLPLWVVLGNYIVALIVSLLVAFLASMINALRVMRSGGRHDPGAQSASGRTPVQSQSDEAE